MIEFILNNKLIQTNELPGSILLDFIRKNEKLYGTKIGCREGDCGACTVLAGSLINDEVQYQTVVSCLTPLGNIAGKHVVTIEGINGECRAETDNNHEFASDRVTRQFLNKNNPKLNKNTLSPVQSAFVNENATQCGFCSPGFVVSLTGFSLSSKKTRATAINSVAGNICRCTGYKSIERAVSIIVKKLRKKSSINSLQWLIENNFIPSYFEEIPGKLKKLKPFEENSNSNKIIGGGTDILVQKADEVTENKLRFIKSKKQYPRIYIEDTKCIIDAACVVTDLIQSKVLHDIIPNLKKYLKLVSSEQIRNMATIAGNIVNASPIGDLIILFLTLDSKLIIEDNKGNKKSLLLKDFYKGYKKIELKEGEIVKSLQFLIPDKGFKFNFEKVSKRTHLDIASVNTAIYIIAEKQIVKDIRISAGGLAAIPLLLAKTTAFLKGKELSLETIKKASEIINTEISPISDIRGSSNYKKLLLRQLFFQHFIKLYPELFDNMKLV